MHERETLPWNPRSFSAPFDKLHIRDIVHVRLAGERLQHALHMRPAVELLPAVELKAVSPEIENEVVILRFRGEKLVDQTEYLGVSVVRGGMEEKRLLRRIEGGGRFHGPGVPDADFPEGVDHKLIVGTVGNY